MFNSVDYVRAVSRSVSKYDKIIDLNFGLNTSSRAHKLWLSRRATLDSFVTLKYELAEVDIKKRFSLDYTRNKAREEALFNKVVHNDDYILFHGSSDYGTAVTTNADNVVHFRKAGS